MTTFHPYSDHAFTSNHFSSTSGGSVSPDTDEGIGKAKLSKWSKEGPVKNACLSCRTKKAKCDGTQPVCGQVRRLLRRLGTCFRGKRTDGDVQCVKKGLECLYVKSRRGGARKKREGEVNFLCGWRSAEAWSVIAPSALQEFLKRLDGLLGLPDYTQSISPGTSLPSDDATNIVRQFASRDEMYLCPFTRSTKV